MEHATNAGRRVTEVETAEVKGAKARENRKGNGGCTKSEHGYKEAAAAATTATTAATREEASS